MTGEALEIATAGGDNLPAGAFLEGYKALFNEWGPGPVERQEKRRQQIDEMVWDVQKESLQNFARRLAKKLRLCPALVVNFDRECARVFQVATRRTGLDFSIPAAIAARDQNMTYPEIVRLYRNHYEDNISKKVEAIGRVYLSGPVGVHADPISLVNRDPHEPPSSSGVRDLDNLNTNNPTTPRVPTNNNQNKRAADDINSQFLIEMKKLRSDMKNQMNQNKNQIREEVAAMIATEGKGGKGAAPFVQAPFVQAPYNPVSNGYAEQHQYQWNKGNKGKGKKGKMPQDKSSSSSSPRPFNGQCNNCWGWGHMAQNCPSPATNAANIEG